METAAAGPKAVKDVYTARSTDYVEALLEQVGVLRSAIPRLETAIGRLQSIPEESRPSPEREALHDFQRTLTQARVELEEVQSLIAAIRPSALDWCTEPNPPPLVRERILAGDKCGIDTRRAILLREQGIPEDEVQQRVKAQAEAEAEPEPDPVPSASCCKVCSRRSKACGNSCISLKRTCHKPRGCACDS